LYIVAAMSSKFCFYWLAGKLYWLLNFGTHLELWVQHVLAKTNLLWSICFCVKI